MLVIPAPIYSLTRTVWIPRLTIWHDDDTTERREGKPRESWAEAMAASWRLASLRRISRTGTPGSPPDTLAASP